MPRRRPAPPPDPDDVLAGRVEVRLEELFQLIHAINPSGRELTERSQRDAYARKTALQSLLIERFGEFLRVETVPGANDDVVGLHHRTYAKDACHALRSQLTPAARAWVQLQLDLAAEAPAEDRATPAPVPFEEVAAADPGARLEAGRRALDEYDFEQAEQHFRAALHPRAEPAERLLAARALVGLFVDHLADDAQALALRDELPMGWDQDTELRCVLAIAAARSGDPRTARQLGAGLDHPRVDEVWIELARHALSEDDLDGCAQALDRVLPNRDSSTARQSVADALAQRRADAATVLEAELTDPDLAADPTAVEELAHRILTLHSDNETAHRVLRDLRQREEQRRAEALIAEIEGCLARGSSDHARALFTELASAAPHRPHSADLDARIAAAERAAAERSVDTAVEVLTAALAQPLTADTVRAYWDASEAVRGRAREATAAIGDAARALAWLDALGPVKGHSRCEATAHAAAALADAEACVERGEGEAAVTALGPHIDLIARSPQGEKLLKAARAAFDARRRDDARAVLADAERLEPDDPTGALAGLSTLEERALDTADRHRAQELVARLERARALGAKRADARAAEARGDLITARAVLRWLAAETGPDERERYSAQAEALTSRIDAQWIEDRAAGAAVAVDHELARPRGVHLMVGEGGDGRAIRAHQLGARVFVRILAEDPEHALAVVLHPPVRFELVGIGAEGDRVGLIGREGILWLDSAALEIREFEPWSRSTSLPNFEGATLGPASRFAWIASSTADGRQEVRVIDRRGAFPPSPVLDATCFCGILGAASPIVVRSRYRNDWEILDERGQSLFSTRGSFVFHSATLDPTARGVLVVTGLPLTQGAGGGTQVTAQAFALDGTPGPSVDLVHAESPDLDVARSVASSRQGCAFIATPRSAGRALLIALGADQGELHERWRTSIPQRSTLSQSTTGRDAMLQVNDGESIELLRLGVEPPQLPVCDVAPQNFPDLRIEHPCEWRSDDETRHAGVFEAVLRLLDGAQISARVSAWLTAETAQPEDLLALTACKLPRATLDAVLDAIERDPVSLATADLAVAEHRVRRGEHDAALRLLEAADSRTLEPAAAQHHLHLTALCRLALGETSQAHAAYKRAAKRRHGCQDLEALADFLAALRAAAPTDPRRLRGASIASTVGRLRAADRELERGDGAAALTFLEHPSVWTIRHPMCSVRLAEAWLLVQTKSGPETFRAREVFAELVDHHARADAASRGPECGELSPSAERFERAVARAVAWLGDELPPAGALREEAPEPDRPYPQPGAFVGTMVMSPARSAGPAMPLDGPQHQERLEEHQAGLRAAIRKFAGPRSGYQVAGLVVDASHPDVATYRSAAEHLLGLPQPDGDAVLPVAYEAVFAVLRDWPKVYERFLQHLEETRASRAPFAMLLCAHGAAFRSMVR